MLFTTQTENTDILIQTIGYLLDENKQIKEKLRVAEITIDRLTEENRNLKAINN